MDPLTACFYPSITKLFPILIGIKVLKATMSTVGAAVCVSHTCRDNFILRAHMLPSVVHVIPNAVDTSKFIPDPSKRKKHRSVVFRTYFYSTSPRNGQSTSSHRCLFFYCKDNGRGSITIGV